MASITIEELSLGQETKFERTITPEMIDAFGAASGDYNPVHFNEEYAKNSMFGQRIAHGMLTGSFFSTILGTLCPGEGTIYLSQELKFLKPVFIGEKITAIATVAEIIVEKNRVVFDTIAVNEKGEKVVAGKAVVLPPKKK